MEEGRLRLFADVRGEGKPVVLLHGLFGSFENLGRVARLLAENYQVHSLDLRNHGKSPHASNMNYPLMVEDVMGYMDETGLSSAYLIGHSMGGKVAMQMALTYPERVEALVVIDIAPVEYPPHHNEIIAGLKAIDQQQIVSREQADQMLKPFVDDTAVRQFLLKNLRRNEEGRFVWRINLPAILAHYDDIMQGQEGEPFDKPVLFVAGGDSDYIQSKHRAQVLRLFPEAQMRVIPGTDHWLHAQKPQLFVTTVKRFFNTIADA